MVIYFFRVSDLELDSTHPKKVFIRETIEKEIRLSYYSKIKDSLPQAYHILLPGEPSGPYFDYDLPSSLFIFMTKLFNIFRFQIFCRS